MSQEQMSESVSLSLEQQKLFDQDVHDLKEGEEKYDMQGKLVGRTKFGLDPAGMMVVRDTAPLVEKIAQSLGTHSEKIWPLIKELHEQGPWNFADRLRESTDAEIKSYLVLAAACHESGWPGYSPDKYLEDRTRVTHELESFTPDQFDSCKQSMQSKIKNLEDATITINGKEVKVALVDDDAALPLSTMGYKGCVVRQGADARFAQTSTISDELLEQSGLIKGFGEIFDPETKGFKRVAPETPGARIVWIAKEDEGKSFTDMKPKVKRIASGFVLTYADEALALDLVRKSVAEKN